MKVRLIVSSVVFMKFLKDVLAFDLNCDSIQFELENGIIVSNDQTISVHSNESGLFYIDRDSVKRMAKVLKRIQEQPISIQMDDSSYFTLTCACI